MKIYWHSTSKCQGTWHLAREGPRQMECHISAWCTDSGARRPRHRVNKHRITTARQPPQPRPRAQHLLGLPRTRAPLNPLRGLPPAPPAPRRRSAASDTEVGSCSTHRERKCKRPSERQPLPCRSSAKRPLGFEPKIATSKTCNKSRLQ